MITILLKTIERKEKQKNGEKCSAPNEKNQQNKAHKTLCLFVLSLPFDFEVNVSKN